MSNSISIQPGLYNLSMERTVPSATSEEIRLYLTTLYSLLRSTSEVQVRTLEEVHAGMNSSLHPKAHHAAPDTSAFIYSMLRLPDCMPQVRSIILGQSDEVFSRHGFPMVESGSRSQPVLAAGAVSSTEREHWPVTSPVVPTLKIFFLS